MVAFPKRDEGTFEHSDFLESLDETQIDMYVSILLQLAIKGSFVGKDALFLEVIELGIHAATEMGRRNEATH